MLPLTNLQGAAAQPVTSNDWIVPAVEPQSLYGVADQIEPTEASRTARKTTVDISRLSENKANGVC